MELDGAVVVVTGATRGIGRETALAFGDAGARVVIVGRSTNEAPHRVLPGSLETVEEELRARSIDVRSVRADLAQPNDVERLIATLEEWYSGCDVLVNNAAYSLAGSFLEVAPSRWMTAWKINVAAPAALTRALVGGMLERGRGHIITIGSAAAIQDVPRQLPYGVTKAALERLTTGLHFELGGNGVSFNCLRVDEMVPTEAFEYMHVQIGLEPDAHMRPPSDVAQGVVWLARQPSTFSGRIVTLTELRAQGVLPPLSEPVGSSGD